MLRVLLCAENASGEEDSAHPFVLPIRSVVGGWVVRPESLNAAVLHIPRVLTSTSTRDPRFQ